MLGSSGSLGGFWGEWPGEVVFVVADGFFRGGCLAGGFFGVFVGTND